MQDMCGITIEKGPVFTYPISEPRQKRQDRAKALNAVNGQLPPKSTPLDFNTIFLVSNDICSSVKDINCVVLLARGSSSGYLFAGRERIKALNDTNDIV